MLGIDWSSTDFANNIDDVFDRGVMGAAFVTFALFGVIDQALAIAVADPVLNLVAKIGVLFISLYVFAYWGKVMGRLPFT